MSNTPTWRIVLLLCIVALAEAAFIIGTDVHGVGFESLATYTRSNAP